MAYSWILFDVDDTLLDFPACEAWSLERTFPPLGIPLNNETRAAYHTANRQVWAELEQGVINSHELRSRRFRLCFKVLGLNADPVLAGSIFTANLAQTHFYVPHALEVVNLLSRSYRLAVVTNGLAEVQHARLAQSAFKGCFEQVFVSEELGAAKPSPRFFDRVFATIDYPPLAQVLIVGDSLASDMQGGINYGIDCCWYNPRQADSDLAITYNIQSLAQLPVILERCSS